MRFVWYAAGYALRDKKTNTNREDEVGQTSAEKEENRLENLQRMPSERASKQLLYYRPTGRREAKKKML
jgi:hypothetical protein